jgi:uncharacterized membrane protein
MNKIELFLNNLYNNKLFQNAFVLGGIFFLINFITKALFAGTYSLWIDEANQVSMAINSIGGVWEEHSSAANGPFYTWVLSFWIKLFGISEFSVRLLSVLIVSIASVVLYVFSKRFFNHKTAVISTLLFTFGDSILYYSHEARSYTLILLFTILSFHLMFLLIENFSWKKLISYFLILTALLYTHLTLVLIFFVQFSVLMLYFKAHKKAVIYSVLAQFFAGMLILLWLLNNNWFGGNETTWAPIPTIKDFFVMLKRYLNMVDMKILLMLLILLIGLVFFSIRGSRFTNKVDFKKLFTVVAWALFPIVAMWLISVYYNPRFVQRYMLFATPGIYLSIGYILSLLKKRYLLSSLIVIPFLVVYILNLNLSPGKPENWRQINKDLKGIKNDSTIVFISASYMHWPFSYYYDKDIFVNEETIYPELIKENIHFVNTMAGIKESLLNEYEKTVIILSHNNVVDPNRTIKNYFFKHHRLKNAFKYLSIEMYEFENLVDDQKAFDTLCYSFDDDALFHGTIEENKDAYSGDKVCNLKPASEYSATYEATMRNFVEKGTKVVTISAMVKPITKVDEIKLVVEINSGKDGSNLFYSNIALRELGLKQNWSQIAHQFYLNGDFSVSDKIKIYFWNPSKEHILIDDMCIKL